MKRTPKHPPAGARRVPSPAPAKSQAASERRTKGERRKSEENRREFERFSPTQPPSERRQSERRTGSH